jgi:hypothetical protein
LESEMSQRLGVLLASLEGTRDVLSDLAGEETA